MSTERRPATRIEWAGVEGITIVCDEDGVHLRFPPKSQAYMIEQCDVKRLFDLWNEACTQFTDGRIVAPRVPTREEMTQKYLADRDEYARIRAIRAITAAFDSAPF